jgi:hypothetical protein
MARGGKEKPVPFNTENNLTVTNPTASTDAQRLVVHFFHDTRCPIKYDKYNG